MMSTPAGFFLAMASAPEGGNIFLQLIPFLLVLAIFYFVILMPMRKKQQKVQEFQESLKVGDKVVTTGGMYGVITRVDGDVVQLQIADKVRIEMSKAAIGGLQGAPPVVEPANQ